MNKSLEIFHTSLVLFLCAAVSGCAVSTDPILMYDQSVYSEDEVAVLLPAWDQGIAMVLEIDGETAGGSCLTGCMFTAPAHVAPGLHRFKTSNMQGPGYTSLTSTATFDFEAEVEAGKYYRLQVRMQPRERGERQQFLVWWEEVAPPLEAPSQ